MRCPAICVMTVLDSINDLVNYPRMPRAPAAPAAEERPRDADRSQATILAAARDEFAEYGLGGARMDRIAERAGLNKRLIYYYFSRQCWRRTTGASELRNPNSSSRSWTPWRRFGD